MNRKFLLIALPLLAGLVLIAGYALYANAQRSVRFAPQDGDNRNYFVATRVRIMPDGNHAQQQALSSRGVVQYRVEQAHDPIKLRSVPQLLTVEQGGRTLFSSDDADDAPQQVADLLRSGFRITIDADGNSRIERADDAPAGAADDMPGAIDGDMFREQLVMPAIPKTLPAREGAEVTLDDFQGLAHVTLTVTAADDDALTVKVAGEADTLDADANPLLAQLSAHNVKARIADVRLEGRMRLERDSGWLQSMAVVSTMHVSAEGKSATLRSLTLVDRRANPAAGDYADGLEAMLDTLPEEQAGPIPLPQDDTDVQPEPDESTTDPELGKRHPVFAAHGRRLVLAIDIDDYNASLLTGLRLDDLTLYDADDRPLDIPLALQSVDYDSSLEGASQAIAFELGALGWDDPKLARVARVEATLSYMPTQAEGPVKLTLDDQPRALSSDKSRVEATPVKGQDNTWRLDLKSAEYQDYYWFDTTTPQPGIEARMLGRAPGDWLSTGERIALASAADRWQWINHIQIQADHAPAELALRHVRAADERKQYTLSFQDYARRYSDRSLPPPDTKTLASPAAGDNTAPDGPLSIDDVQTVDADKNRLRLVLPSGVGRVCALSADAPPLAGHALVWQPRPAPRSYYQRNEAKDAPGQQTWELATDDGVRTYFYDIDVDTTLRCPGTPRWQTTTIDSDTPWLIDLQQVTGRAPDPTRTAADYFEGIRFMDDRGRRLRPMLKDAKPDTRPAAWPQESADHALGDYLYDDGKIRLWGSAARVVALRMDGAPIVREWHDTLEALP